jgi:hypothetical protein
LVPLPGARNIRALSARFIADIQTHWEEHGMSALDEVRQKFPDRYVDNYVMLARVIRLEADVKHSLAVLDGKAPPVSSARYRVHASVQLQEEPDPSAFRQIV